MTWFRVDDQLPDHRKVRRLGADRLPSMGLWTLCGAWASRNSDGFVPDEVVTRYDPDHFFAKRLSEVGLWTETEEGGETGYEFHDWLQYRPTQERERKVREDTRRRVQAYRGRKRAEQAQRNPDGTFGPADHAPLDDPEDDGNEGGNALPSNAGNATCNPAPDPTRTRSVGKSPNVGSHLRSDSASAETDPDLDDEDEPAGTDERNPPREDVEALCTHLRDAIIANESKTPRITKTWRKEARLLIDSDQRPLDKAHRLIDWSQNHHHWRTRIFSMTKFRAHYDAMRMQANSEHERQRGPQKQVPTTTARVQGAYSLLRPEDDDFGDDQLQLPGGRQ